MPSSSVSPTMGGMREGGRQQDGDADRRPYAGDGADDDAAHRAGKQRKQDLRRGDDVQTC